jgi:hypothetical protein
MAAATPINTDPSVAAEPFLDFTSGYVQRALGSLPKQGSKFPWRIPQSYFADRKIIRHGPIDDGTLRFSNPAPAPVPARRTLEPAE